MKVECGYDLYFICIPKLKEKSPLTFTSYQHYNKGVNNSFVFSISV